MLYAQRALNAQRKLLYPKHLHSRQHLRPKTISQLAMSSFFSLPRFQHQFPKGDKHIFVAQQQIDLNQATRKQRVQNMVIKFPLLQSGSNLITQIRPAIVAAATAVILTGCSSTGDGMSGFDLSGMDWFNSVEPPSEESFVVGSIPSTYGAWNDQESDLHNAIALAKQKRFLEARILLTELREIQHGKSDGYRALSCAMALLALREGDIWTFKRIARQLDISLEIPVRVPPAYVEVVSLYRAMSNQGLPVNAPERIQRMRDQLLPAETASINEESQ